MIRQLIELIAERTAAECDTLPCLMANAVCAAPRCVLHVTDRPAAEKLSGGVARTPPSAFRKPAALSCRRRLWGSTGLPARLPTLEIWQAYAE